MKHWLLQLRQFLIKRSSQKYSAIQVLVAGIFGSAFELIFIPSLLLIGGRIVDSLFGLKDLFLEKISFPLGFACLFFGAPWLFWSIYWQHKYGKGTPFPLVPTKVFLDRGPYRYVRNPMYLGALFWLSGWALIADSPTALCGGVGLFAGVVFFYIKSIEEPELEEKFGNIYRIYKRKIPFIVPNFGKSKID